MKNEIQKLISELEERSKSHQKVINTCLMAETERVYTVMKSECDFVIDKLKLLLNEQPEAITDDAHFCKHDVGRSAASDDTTNIGDFVAASSETQAVGQNEQTKEVCPCSTEERFVGWTEADGNYCCSCGKPIGCVRPG